MFFILSKTIPFLVQPTAIILISWLSYFLFKKWSKRKYFLYSSLGLFILFTNDFIANKTLLNYQYAPVSSSELTHADYGILLTGMTNTVMLPDDRVYFNHNADRLLQAISLLNQDKFDTLIISGGGATALRKNIQEAAVIKKYLQGTNTDLSKIIIEDSSRNTYESAQFIKKKIRMAKSVLITSASHMPRALAVYNKEGLDPAPYPAVYLTNNQIITPSMFIPGTPALVKWNILFKEWQGMIAYKLAGYI